MATNRLSNETEIVDFDYDEDIAAVKRIWREIGWTDDENGDAQVERFYQVGKTLVAKIENGTECAVHTTQGTMRLDRTDLKLCAVTAVVTSRIARGQAFAKRLTALQLRAAAEAGAEVAALGMFDQGFYDKLGFGTGAYDNEFTFDPGTLRVARSVPTPRRLGVDDFADMHAAMKSRPKVNGSVVIEPAALFRAEVGFEADGFGLGFHEGERLTHFLYIAPNGEHGPYRIRHMAYQDAEQLMELLAVLRSLGDQVFSVKMMEPPEIQLQALIERPFRARTISRQSDHAARHIGIAWWQARVMDMSACVQALHLRGADVRFQLEVTDPVTGLLDDAGWRGVAGRYVVQLGEQSHAEAGEDNTLPMLSCSVNALTRLLWCVASASSLAITDDLHADASLLGSLDEALRLAPPHPGWDF